MSRLSNILASGHLNLNLPVRLVLWALSSVILSAIFFREFWVALPEMLSPTKILGQNQASPWGVLALCFIFLWLKRKSVRDNCSLSPTFFSSRLGWHWRRGLS